MGKLTTYLIIMIGVITLFHLFGLIENTGTSLLVNLAFNPENIKTMPMYSIIVTALTAIIGVAVSLFATKDKSDFAITSLIVTGLLNLGWDFLAVFNVVKAESTIAAVLILSPLMIVWFFTVIEWWRGVDTWL